MALTVIDQAALNWVLQGPAGPVMAHVAATAEAIRDVAASYIHTKTGALAASGQVRPLPGHVEVAFTADHAASVELGARPHVIAARNGRALAFNWPKAGGMVFFARVNHPGNEGQHYLLRAAATIGAAPLA